MTRADELISECCRVWAPPPKQTLSEWAEENFVLSPEYSAVSGKLRLHSFQRDIFDSFTDPYVQDIVVMCATQMVKTLFLQAIVAYVIARDPGPILLAQPTETDAETFSKERLAPMIRDCESLRGKISEAKRGKGDNTTLHKMFPGGSLSLIGAQTPGNFARRTIKVFLADERDKWLKTVGKEGDGYSLGVKRTARFRSRAKRVQVCSPTVKGDSAIATAYELTDQQRRWIPCPECGQHQVLRWAQVRDPRLPGRQVETTAYECEFCRALWSDVQRWEACDRGEWRADRPEVTGRRGFWISELYCEWRKLSDLVDDFLAKKDNPAELQTFINTSLAELWEQAGEAPAWEVLLSRREGYRLGEVPPGVLFLTAGVDVQKTWLQGHVWGWGRGRQRWLVDRFIPEGDPYHADVWDRLTGRLNTTYRHAAGAELAIVRMAVDSGYATQEVYRWARQQGSGRVMVVKGVDSGAALVSTPQQVEVSISGKKIRHGARVYMVNVSMCKSELYGLLGKERPADGEPYPAGWVHVASDCDEEFFRQLTAEQLVWNVRKGYRRSEWVKTRERNEDLDCCNYARAAASVFGLDRFSEHRWRDMEVAIGAIQRREAPAQAEVAEAVAEPPARVPVAQRRRREGGWFDSGRNWF